MLPNPDVVMKKTGKTLADYRELLYDPHTAACTRSRKAGVTSLEWMLEHDDTDDKAVIVQERLGKLKLYNLIENLLDAPLYGMQPCEVLWEVSDGMLLPKEITAKPADWFIFGSDGALRLRTRENALDGVELPPFRFLVARHNHSYFNPYGESILSSIWWAQFFKRNVQRFWNTFTEKFGTPFVSVTHPYGNDAAKVDALVDSVVEMVQDAVIALPQGAEATIQSVTTTANADMYKEFVSFCNAEISKAILGQTLSTEMSATGGSYAATKAHLDVRADIVESDKRLVQETINELIQWIYELNFGDTTAAPVFVLYEESEVDKRLAERDKILFDSGIRFTKTYISKSYGLEDNDFELAEAIPTPTAEVDSVQQPAAPVVADFAAQTIDADTVQAAIESVVAKTSSAEYRQQAMDVITPIAKLVKNATSFEQVQKGLIRTFGDMDTKRFSARLGTQVAVTGALGAKTIEDEAGADFAAQLPIDFADDVPPITPARIALAFEMVPEKALEFLFGKTSAIYASFKNISADVFRLVFTVAGVMQMDVLVAIRALVEKAIAEGQSFEDFQAAMSADGLISAALPRSRWETIYRTNLQSAFMAARYREQVRLGERKPFWKFVAVLDRSTTAGCRDLDGKIFRYDDGFWSNNYPPRHYRCRSRVVALNDRELARYGGEVESGDDYKNVQPDESFASTPDTPFEPKKADYPPDVWKEFNKR